MTLEPVPPEIAAAAHDYMHTVIDDVCNMWFERCMEYAAKHMPGDDPESQRRREWISASLLCSITATMIEHTNEVFMKSYGRPAFNAWSDLPRIQAPPGGTIGQG